MKKIVVTAFFAFLVALLLTIKVEAMPEAVQGLAYDYYLYKVENPESDNPAPNLFEYFRRDLDFAYAGEGAEGMYDPDIYNDSVVSKKKAISIMRNRNTYSQERAVNELGRMIDSGNFPANYIFAKGQYKYTSDINAVLVKTNLRLRSQPNTQAKILKTLRSRRDWDGGPDICNYMGEWTNPQGERWVLVSYDDYEKGKLIGWLSGKYTQFITDAQIMEVANAFEKALAAPRRTARNENGRYERSSASYTASSGSTKRSYDTYEEQVIAEKVSSYPVWTFSELVDNWNAASKHARKMEELKQKRICVVGKVVRVDKATVFNYPYIKLEDTHRNFWSSPMVIDCDFSHGDNYVFDLDIGDVVVVEGQVGGVLFDTLYLEKCKATTRFVSR